MSTIVQQVSIPQFLQQTVASTIAFIPNLVGAIIILIVGWLIGRGVSAVVARLTDRVKLDRAVLRTPIGGILGGTESAVSHTFGRLSAWFIYAIAILAAANVLNVPILSAWIARAVSYLPAFIAGLLIIVLGIIVADFIGDVIERTRAARQTSYTSWFANGARVFLYFVAIIVGLGTMGIDVTVLNIVVQAFAWGFAAAIAIGVGVAIGWGGKDYVAENIDSWMGQAKQATPSGDSYHTDDQAPTTD